MSLFTKRGVDVASPVDINGKPRRLVPSEFQVWMTEAEQVMAAGSTGAIIFGFKEEMDASLGYNQGQMAWVFKDETPADNGIYRKVGSSGTGSWVRQGDLPYSFIKATNAGAGTANAIQATTTIPLPAADGGALIAVNIVADNTGATTVSFNGGTALSILGIDGQAVAGGDLLAGMIVAGYKAGTAFRLITDPTSLANKLAAEAAQAAAEEWANNPHGTPVSTDAGGNGIDDYSAKHWAEEAAAPAAIINNNFACETFVGDGVTTAFALAVSPGSKNNTWISVDGAYQRRASYTLGGTGMKTITFLGEAPIEGADIEVVYGDTVAVGVPSDGTIGQTKLSFTVSNYALTLLDDADAATGRGTLGLGSLAIQNAAAVDVDGGTIDGAAIGGATPAAGAFTTLSYTTSLTLKGGTNPTPIAEGAVEWDTNDDRLVVGNGLSQTVFYPNGINSVVQQVFTASGTYTPTAGMAFAIIECIGGGGGGGGVSCTATAVAGGGGGGGGGYSSKLVTAATVGASQTVTIGTAGAGGTSGANNGTAGGNASVGTLCTANGGSGGLASNAGAGAVGGGGAGGAPGTGDIAIAGSPGHPGFLATGGVNVFGFSGHGGSSRFGSPGRGAFGAVGNAASGYGAGGAGGHVSQAAANQAGGNGAPPLAIITEFVRA